MRKKRMTRERREREMAEVLAWVAGVRKGIGIGFCSPYFKLLDDPEDIKMLDATAESVFYRLEPFLGAKEAFAHVSISTPDRFENGSSSEFMQWLLFRGNTKNNQEAPGELLRLDDFRGLKRKKKSKKAA